MNKPQTFWRVIRGKAQISSKVSWLTRTSHGPETSLTQFVSPVLLQVNTAEKRHTDWQHLQLPTGLINPLTNQFAPHRGGV